MNEATFEARANEAIRNIFPNYASLVLTHQLIFSVKLGHDVIEVKPSTRKPRLDILIKEKARNLAILELKKPEHPLTNEDRDQGLSYARLLVPMPPLVIVSNGNKTSFYETVSGAPLDINSPNAKQLEMMFAHALQIAATEKDIAIRTLLGKDPLIWEKVISDLNRNCFQNLIGTINTFYQPIADSFNLPRQNTQRIVDLVGGHNPVVAITGAPMVGKTNVLYEICQLKDVPFVPLYINAEDCQFGIFQYLANHFTKHFFIVSSTEDVRYWLQHGIINNRHPAGKIVIIVDNVRYVDQKVIQDINELIELCSSGTSCSLVIACDSSNYHLMAHVPGRPRKTLFGRKALKVEINNLNDVEFQQARKYLMEHWSADFHKGAQYSRELRNPRVLRMIISDFPIICKEDTQLKIPSSLPFRALNWVLRGFNNDPKFIDDMVKLVKVSMLQESSSHILELMVSYGRGHVPYHKAESILGEVRLERLLQQGHIDLFTDKEQNQYVAPKVPELLAAVAVETLVREVKNLDFEQAVSTVLQQSERLPYGDLIAANVFERLSNESGFPLFELIVRLVKEPPRVEKVVEDFNGAMYFDDIGLFTIPKDILNELSNESNMFSNLFPWLVLSQLVTEPLMIVEGNDDPWYVYREILLTVGGYHHVLRRFDPISDPQDAVEYMTHTLRSSDGIEGDVLCGEVGIIEPITYAMQRGFYVLPNEIIKICKYAVQEKDPFLSHRLHNAAKSLINIDDEVIARAVTYALKILKEVH